MTNREKTFMVSAMAFPMFLAAFLVGVLISLMMWAPGFDTVSEFDVLYARFAADAARDLAEHKASAYEPANHAFLKCSECERMTNHRDYWIQVNIIRGTFQVETYVAAMYKGQEARATGTAPHMWGWQACDTMGEDEAGMRAEAWYEAANAR